ncbi:hypothetical protein DPEC_G00204240 [Dallia pectoralis]|uniref:Uncharacterized protein n=1 Tax=Dallia pectoralis TaxID=75939 RepID=A0ACC2G9X6_DALPE|nr:hypothetical protein DPEC_G00204240 [Dallia pectoralis]
MATTGSLSLILYTVWSMVGMATPWRPPQQVYTVIKMQQTNPKATGAGARHRSTAWTFPNASRYKFRGPDLVWLTHLVV